MRYKIVATSITRVEANSDGQDVEAGDNFWLRLFFVLLLLFGSFSGAGAAANRPRGRGDDDSSHFDVFVDNNGNTFHVLKQPDRNCGTGWSQPNPNEFSEFIGPEGRPKICVRDIIHGLRGRDMGAPNCASTALRVGDNYPLPSIIYDLFPNVYTEQQLLTLFAFCGFSTVPQDPGSPNPVPKVGEPDLVVVTADFNDRRHITDLHVIVVRPGEIQEASQLSNPSRLVDIITPRGDGDPVQSVIPGYQGIEKYRVFQAAQVIPVENFGPTIDGLVQGVINQETAALTHWILRTGTDPERVRVLNVLMEVLKNVPVPNAPPKDIAETDVRQNHFLTVVAALDYMQYLDKNGVEHPHKNQQKKLEKLFRALRENQ